MSILNLRADMIDVRDIIARIEDLEEDLPLPDEDDAEELQNLRAVMSGLADMGGDEQWEGVWYPLMLIADWHFEAFAQELADDLGGLPTTWPGNCIDWERAAKELRYDYSAIHIDGRTYWAC